MMHTLKRFVQTGFRRAGLLYRLKASPVYDLYWRIADRSLLEARTAEVNFYRVLLQGLRRQDLVFDIGANDGIKTDVFLRLGARVVAVEPDQHNQKILHEKFQRLRLTPKAVQIVGKAVSDKIGVETMWIDGPGSAVNTLSQRWAETLKIDKKRLDHDNCGLDFVHQQTVETTTLEELIATHGLPFFVKIDVEGYEINVLRGLKQPLPYLSFEVNLPEFRPQGMECVGLLQGLGADGKFNYAVDCRRGLAHQVWLSSADFAEVLERCAEPTIEVFWKTYAHAGR
jgi:FkbM family methyltransferase